MTIDHAGPRVARAAAPSPPSAGTPASSTAVAGRASRAVAPPRRTPGISQSHALPETCGRASDAAERFP